MNVLDFYSSYDYRACYLDFLAQVNEVRVNSLVEVGVWDGRNARILRSFFPKTQMYLVDPWKPDEEYLKEGRPMSQNPNDYNRAYERARSYFKNDSRAMLLRMTSEEGAQKIPDGVDLVFIDGDHSYEHVKRDIELWKKKVRPGGLLTGHDYCDHCPGVVKAVDELLEGKFTVGRDSVWATVV